MRYYEELTLWCAVPWEDCDCRSWQPIVLQQLAEEATHLFATDWTIPPEGREAA
jgi:hypothetical protein